MTPKEDAMYRAIFDREQRIKELLARIEQDQQREAALVEALKFYAEEENYDLQHNIGGWGQSRPIVMDRGTIATTALQKLGVTV